MRKKIQKLISTITNDAYPFNDADKLQYIGIDSLKLVELIIMIEDSFNIRFDDSELDITLLDTVGDVLSLVKNTITNNGSAKECK